MNAIYIITLQGWHDFQRQTVSIADQCCTQCRDTCHYKVKTTACRVGEGGRGEVIMGATTGTQATAIGSILPTPWASWHNVQSLPNPRAQLSFWLEQPSHLLSCLLLVASQIQSTYVVLYVELHMLRVNAKWNTQQLHSVSLVMLHQATRNGCHEDQCTRYVVCRYKMTHTATIQC